ncbi:Alpha/Beta hydrolase protein [Rhexocercosporidium sp. MPI-PUGE-AT-0058]|nr:Alpha/Beta hydrolase protein [Rhexocercosporidium sp. MPI-PUGE-AT-0058]
MSQLLGLQEFRSSISTQAARSAFQTPNPISGVATLADVPQEYLKYPVPDDCKLLILPDGRHMAYAEYGSKAHDAHPFIFVHGLPDTRLDACLLSSDVTIAEKLNIRWIGIDRPGYGLSTFQSNRTVLGWVDDIQHLIRHLKLTKYHILSVSGGTPYALACAKLLPREGLLSVGIAMGVGPKEAGKEGLSMLNRLVEWIWEKHLWAFEKILDGYVVPKVHEESPERTEAFVRQSSKHMTKVDREAWEGEEMIQGLVKIFREVYRQGSSKGYVEDIKLVTGHWGYDLNDVGYEGVRLFYGKRDVNTPPALGRYMAARLPNSVLKEYDGKTHFTMWDHVEEMLLDMLGKTKTDEESH